MKRAQTKAVTSLQKRYRSGIPNSRVTSKMVPVEVNQKEIDLSAAKVIVNSVIVLFVWSVFVYFM